MAADLGSSKNLILKLTSNISRKMEVQLDKTLSPRHITSTVVDHKKSHPALRMQQILKNF